ncbi:aromatic amino acid aminotransferase 1 [Plectosphaerella cucumerina]|uniref:Aromatic amino acid aminotransferase 1 n=1 Tax=Plectosphaerella cucumerina TaxID=40658 RepID=A0A8K0TGD2_9PEZI|nr:aromatic amino acid aminotransferase 1 [Plectosphaerella cucumerina]
MEAAPPPPLDLSHHFSFVTRARQASNIKKYYKFFQIPGIGNLAGGLPNASLFPFDTLEAQTAKPERWTPTPNHPPTADALSARLAAASLSSAPNGLPSRPAAPAKAKTPSKPASPSPDDAHAARHITVPMADARTNPFERIDLTTALQYGTAEGYPPLLSFVRQFTRQNLHPSVPYAGGPDVVLTTGSTDGMAKAVELLTDPWDPARHDIADRPHILSEKFMYPNVLAQTAPRGVRPVAVEIDAEGMLARGSGGLEDVLRNWDPRQGRRPHMMYTVTMGHNPTSGVLSVARRKEIYALCQEFDIIIVEDDPYWYLQFPSARAEQAAARDEVLPASEPAYRPAKSSGFDFLDSLVPSYLAFDVDGRVIRLDTFSKTIAPGCRLGWITAQPAIIERLTRITETTTQQPSGFVQAMVSELLLGPDQPQTAKSAFAALSRRDQRVFSGWDVAGWVRWLEGLRGTYERRMGRMSRILEEGSVQLKQSTPVRDDLADWGVVTKTRLYSFDWPAGGMFIWIRLHFESHPLWQARGTQPRGAAGGRVVAHDVVAWDSDSDGDDLGAPRLALIDGPALAAAFMAQCVRRPYLVVAGPGAMFAIDSDVAAESAWAYHRLCFAAVSEEEIEPCAKRWVAAVHRFWRIKDPREIEELIAEFTGKAGAQAEDAVNLAGFGGGC